MDNGNLSFAANGLHGCFHLNAASFHVIPVQICIQRRILNKIVIADNRNPFFLYLLHSCRHIRRNSNQYQCVDSLGNQVIHLVLLLCLVIIGPLYQCLASGRLNGLYHEFLIIVPSGAIFIGKGNSNGEPFLFSAGLLGRLSGL